MRSAFLIALLVTSVVWLGRFRADSARETAATELAGTSFRLYSTGEGMLPPADLFRAQASSIWIRDASAGGAQPAPRAGSSILLATAASSHVERRFLDHLVIGADESGGRRAAASFLEAVPEGAALLFVLCEWSGLSGAASDAWAEVLAPLGTSIEPSDLDVPLSAAFVARRTARGYVPVAERLSRVGGVTLTVPFEAGGGAIPEWTFFSHDRRDAVHIFGLGVVGSARPYRGASAGGASMDALVVSAGTEALRWEALSVAGPARLTGALALSPMERARTGRLTVEVRWNDEHVETLELGLGSQPFERRWHRFEVDLPASGSPGEGATAESNLALRITCPPDASGGPARPTSLFLGAPTVSSAAPRAITSDPRR